MEKIIENIYEMHLKESDFPFGKTEKEVIDEECALYELLYENLSLKQKQQFVQYAHIVAQRHKQENYAVYEHGFKTAIRLILEGVKD